jgi:hypothetical protein
MVELKRFVETELLFMNVLIYYPPNKLGMSDFSDIDYSTLAERARTELNGKIPNFGNQVWLQGIISEITNSKCNYEFGYEDVAPDYINNNYDCVLLPLANCFHKGWIPYLEKRASYIEQIKIPVYVIACGVQAESYDELDGLLEDVREPATRFIKSVYNTGGEFALRGYFTAEFFERLGFKNAVVTGCPSIYQMGRGLTISNQKVSRKDFSAAINGTFNLPIRDRDLKNADFICQDVYGKYLYDHKYMEENPLDLRRVLKLVKRGNYTFIRALANNKIHLFANTQQWLSYYVESGVDFAFGSRIHGTIMPILAGIPALCYSKDARTREMVEFYDIPSIVSEKDNVTERCLYDLYCDTDYSKFNANFGERYDRFEDFLRKCGFVENINQNNIFMKKDRGIFKEPTIVNQKKIDDLKRIVNRNAILINLLNIKYK